LASSHVNDSVSVKLGSHPVFTSDETLTDTVDNVKQIERRTDFATDFKAINNV